MQNKEDNYTKFADRNITHYNLSVDPITTHYNKYNFMKNNDFQKLNSHVESVDHDKINDSIDN